MEDMTEEQEEVFKVCKMLSEVAEGEDAGIVLYGALYLIDRSISVMPEPDQKEALRKVALYAADRVAEVM